MKNVPKDFVLYELMLIAVYDGIQAILDILKSGGYIPTYSHFPTLDYFDNGLPRFSSFPFLSKEAPKEYSKSILNDKAKIPKSWDAVFDYAIQNERLVYIYQLGPRDDAGENPPSNDPQQQELYKSFRRISVHLFIGELIDRWFYTCDQSQDFRDSITPIYIDWEASVFNEKLDVDIFVPILMIKFGFDRFDLTSHISIEKMGDDFQLARSMHRSYPATVNEVAVGAATHAFVLRGWEVGNSPYFVRMLGNNHNRFASVLQQVETLFAAFRIVTSAETGYGQVCISPDGWAEKWVAHLPPLSAWSVRHYPEVFENHRWLTPPPEFGEAECVKIRDLFLALAESKNDKVALATRRLNIASLRKDEEDIVLDIVIALEVLLGDGNAEMTHKLAMRLAAIFKINPHDNFSPEDVFNIWKKIYAYRSRIVHGGKRKPTDDSSVLVPRINQKLSVIEVGLLFLRYCVSFVATHPIYEDPAKLDKALFSDEASKQRVVKQESDQ